MPLRLVPPKEGRTPYYRVRGTHHGVYIDRSTKAVQQAKARAILRKWRAEIERGAIASPGELTFLDAATAYVAAGGEQRFLGSYDEETGEWDGLLGLLGPDPVASIDQVKIDSAARKLYPEGSPATRNRHIYTPVSSVLKHAGIDFQVKRPKGALGRVRTEWMTPDQAERILASARTVDVEFAIFLATLLYTGLRLSEALALRCDRVALSEGYAYIPTSKNDDPRPVYLPPVLVAALASHPRGLDRRNERVFRFTKGGRLYNLMKEVRLLAGADLHFVSFHIFRHTWATWMRRYAGLDTTGLVATGAWRDRQSAARYEHAVVSEEAERAVALPQLSAVSSK